MTREEFSARCKGLPIQRARRRGLRRNVAAALRNRGAPEATPALNDEQPLVRGHAARALYRIGTAAARQALWRRAEGEAVAGCGRRLRGAGRGALAAASVGSGVDGFGPGE